jgi:hypothetical protein
MAAHTYNPSYTWKVEAGGSVVKRPDYRTLAKPYLSKKKAQKRAGDMVQVASAPVPLKKKKPGMVAHAYNLSS